MVHRPLRALTPPTTQEPRLAPSGFQEAGVGDAIGFSVQGLGLSACSTGYDLRAMYNFWPELETSPMPKPFEIDRVRFPK